MEDFVGLVIAVCLTLLCVPVLQWLERREPGGPGMPAEAAERFTGAETVVVLDPDLAEVFPDSESVNRALRALCEQQSHGPVA
ncbi:MAG: hypothetical protein AVDCRST_MAG68-5390 [uncultured Gemmatimonadetes bacterium]|uniref:Uncharacterized protein n=1 Tax=uncultured Gemmatimonadota bacterium TaxID=203437 RepID=A0A6J4MY49_9BACT|nr:MAG: hypothetical protein AVDCRST_MAG68-5390 [uncultured Gemmatimonadota bacterium]